MGSFKFKRPTKTSRRLSPNYCVELQSQLERAIRACDECNNSHFLKATLEQSLEHLDQHKFLCGIKKNKNHEKESNS